MYVDKYKVREFVADTIGEKYLIKLLDVYKSVEEIKYEMLPNQFVIKGTHGCGYNIIVKDKNEINKSEINKKMKKWLREDYSKHSKEMQYKYIEPRLICEEYLEDSSGELIDYKFYCFNGKVEFIQVISERKTNMSQDFYDLEWNKIDIRDGVKSSNITIERPFKLEEMIFIAERLSSKFLFVRVDLYYVNDNIYFGELTFTPRGGMIRFKPLEEDIRLANLIELKN